MRFSRRNGALAWLAMSSLASPALAAEERKLLALEQGIYHGAFPDIADDASGNLVAGKTTEFQRLSGKDIAWVVLGDQWFHSELKFPDHKVREVQKLGKLPLIQMMPWSVRLRDYGPDEKYDLLRIVRGEFDAQLTDYAKAVKATAQPVAISFAPEMNGHWYPWSGYFQGGGITTSYGDPQLADGPEVYRDAYRRVIQTFRNAGVDNVTWFFHYTAISSPAETWNNVAEYYPGDDFIDWVGVSSYSAQEITDYWEDFSVIMDDAYLAFEAATSTKPFAVMEFGTIEDPMNPYRKADWISNAFAAINSQRYPRLKAISYHHESSWDQTTADYNLRIDSSAAAKTAYAEGVTAGTFISGPKFSGPAPVDYCYCGFVKVNGIYHCSAWKPGDQLLKEYQRWTTCSVDLCKNRMSAATQQYCGGKFVLRSP